MDKVVPESHFPLHSRVKIYLLKANGNWMDHAVGFFQLVKEDHQRTFLRVTQESDQVDDKVDEESRARLVTETNTGEYRWEMNLKLNQDVRYESQGENIMAWFEPDIQEEIALSFKETSYLRETLQTIEALQGKKTSSHFRFDEVEAHQLVMPSHQNLDTLQTQIQEHPETFIQGILHTPQFFEQLRKIFEEAEDLQQDHTLEALYHIFRSLIYLKNEDIILLIMGDQQYMTTFGVLECTYHAIQDSSTDHNDNKGLSKVAFRQFLSESTKFHVIFDDLDHAMVSAINVNFRLTYLKETVMTYYLFQEDPTFIFINNVIQSNNYIIVSTLFAKHHQQFINLLTQLPQNVHQISQFLAEFYMVFIRLPQHFEFKNQIIDLVKKSNMLMLLNTVIRDVTLDSLAYPIEQAQFICQTLLQFQLLFMNIDPQKFTDFLFESTASCQLFWNNIYLLTMSDQIATHPMVCDMLMTLFPPAHLTNQLFSHLAGLLRPQLFQFLARCKSTPMPHQHTITFYEQLLENVANFLPLLNEEYLNLCLPVLEQMKPTTNKQSLIASVKFFRFLIKLDQREVNKYLKDRGMTDTFLMFKIVKRQEGILEGLLRECVLQITKNHTVAQYMVSKVHSEDPLRKSTLFEPLFREFTYVNPQSVTLSLPPPASPQTKINHPYKIMEEHPRLEEEMYYDDEDEVAYNHQDEQKDISEKKIKLQMALKKRQFIQEDEDDHNDFLINQSNSSLKRQFQRDFSIPFIEFESIQKKVKHNENDE